MDFWQFGISSKILTGAGFDAVDPHGDLICPNFFEPLHIKNNQIACCFKGFMDNSFIVCRADGDQDRPNHLEMDD